MTPFRPQLESLLRDFDPATAAAARFRDNPSGLTSAWVDLDTPAALPRLAEALQANGARLGTTTVYRHDVAGAPGDHTIAYHFVLGGMPITVKVRLAAGAVLPSVTPLFPNADWEEREMMELTGIAIGDHPDPRRMFLDESIEAGVYDRYVPYSDFTNAARHEEIWQRVRDTATRAAGRSPEEATP